MSGQDEITRLRARVEALESEVATLRAAAAANMAVTAQGCTCGTAARCRQHPWQMSQVMYPQNTWMGANAAAGGYAGHVYQVPVRGETVYTTLNPAANACAAAGIPQVWAVSP
jgi:hypothetical protein